MPRPKKPFVIQKRKDCKGFLLTLNSTSGLPARVCKEWNRKSFQNVPPELIIHSNPKTKAAAEAGAMALIALLKNNDTSRKAVKCNGDITAGEWIIKFTSITESPKGARNLAENRPYSPHSVRRYKSTFDTHITGDVFLDLRMSEVEVDDVLEFIGRMSRRPLMGKYEKLNESRPIMAGTDSLVKLIGFVKMTFKEYGLSYPRWFNPFQSIGSPKNILHTERDALSENEVLMLFRPKVLVDVMELAVCSAIFLSGLRRSEVFALKPEDLDWYTPKIKICRAWQDFDRKDRVLGPPKGKKIRYAPFDKILQEAIKKLWEENGQHEYVFSFANGKTPGPSWIEGRFKKWLDRAGIEVSGRNITPHSSRHTLASILEERGVSLRYIQEFLGHSDLKTTKIYLHSTDKTIRDIGRKIDAAIEEPKQLEDVPGLQVFKVV